MITLHRRNIDIDEPPDDQVGLFASKSSIFLFGNMKETVKVWWHLSKKENVLDWIGLFNCEDSSCYLDQKPLRRQSSPIFFSLSPKNLLHATQVYFGYIDGITGKMLGRTEKLEICIRANFVIHEISKSLNCLDAKICVETDEEEIEMPERIKKDVKLNFAWQEVRISITPNVQSSSEKLMKFQHIFFSQQFENDCSRSIDDRGSYRIELTYSIQPISNIMNPSALSVIDSMPSTSSSMSTGLSISSNENNYRIETSSTWQMCLDAKGRVFYVNHETKETSWTNPQKDLPRRNIKPKTHVPLINETPRIIRKTHNYDSEAFITPRRTIAVNKKMTEVDDVLALIQFLQRDDFVVVLHENQKAMQIYNQSCLVRQAIHRIQSDIDIPTRFENNPQFVEFINSFSDTSEPLPRGWELLEGDQIVFINHDRKITSFLDPRVRILESKENRRGRSVPPIRSTKMDTNGNHLLIEKIDEIIHIADQKLPHIAGRIRKKLKLVERFGELAIASLANDLDLSLAVSMLESEDENRNKVTKSDENIGNFLGILHRAKFGKGPSKLIWKISRENLIGDSFREILNTDVFSLKKAKLHISFDNEIALDYGGPSREFFILLSRQLFHPKNGYFEYYGTDYYLHLSPCELDSTNSRTWLEMCGRVLALAIIHRCLIDVFFTPIFYKLLLNQKACLEDFQKIDSQFYNSMTWILENDVENLDMRFVFNEATARNQIGEVELLPGGSDLVVTNSNKNDFVELLCEKQSLKGIEKCAKIVSQSFHQILDPELVGGLSPDELSMIVSGSMEIDLIDWRINTIYKGGYFDGHVVIEWFWEIIEKMSNFERFNLLLFVTGSSSVPFEGFSALRGNNGSNKFCIEKWGEDESLPRAHTCFNRLQLPSYATKKIMRLKIQKAIENGMNYSIE